MPEPQRFRKKPIEIIAVQFTGSIEDARQLLGWLVMNGGNASFVGPGEPHALRRSDEQLQPAFLVIETLEGSHRADIGDYVIRGVAGEFYPCKPDIFAATYEPVPENRNA